MTTTETKTPVAYVDARNGELRIEIAYGQQLHNLDRLVLAHYDDCEAIDRSMALDGTEGIPANDGLCLTISGKGLTPAQVMERLHAELDCLRRLNIEIDRSHCSLNAIEESARKRGLID